MAEKGVLQTLFGYRERVGTYGLAASSTPDFTRKPLCECGEWFLDWVEQTFPALDEDINPQLLDEVILVITKEYANRARTTPVHRLNHCLKDVYGELLQAITAKQWELHRTENVSVIKGRVLGEESAQALFIGEELDENT